MPEKIGDCFYGDLGSLLIGKMKLFCGDTAESHTGQALYYHQFQARAVEGGPTPHDPSESLSSE